MGGAILYYPRNAPAGASARLGVVLTAVPLVWCAVAVGR